MFDVQICRCANMQIFLDVQMCGYADVQMFWILSANMLIKAKLVFADQNHPHIRTFAHLHIYMHICIHPHLLIQNMILVTGATGFLGSELAMQLVNTGNNIRCTKRSSSAIPQILTPYHDKIDWVDADMLDIFALEDALDGVTQVYHCAAWVSLKQSDKQPMIRTNVTGTANVVNLCNEHGIRLLHVSSIAAIGQALPGKLINENTHLDETTEDDGYAISKLHSEMEVWRGIAEGLDAVIVNPSLIIGGNSGTAGTGQLFVTVHRGLKFYTQGTGGFVDVEDVAKCMIALMNSEISSERYIISAENISYKNITTAIANGFNINPPKTLAKPWVMEVVWRAAAVASAVTRKDPAMDKVAAQTASLTNNYDNSKIKAAIGIEFKPISKTVKEVCEALRK
jgi:dihydroflavonol-4-reductase